MGAQFSWESCLKERFETELGCFQKFSKKWFADNGEGGPQKLRSELLSSMKRLLHPTISLKALDLAFTSGSASKNPDKTTHLTEPQVLSLLRGYVQAYVAVFPQGVVKLFQAYEKAHKGLLGRRLKRKSSMLKRLRFDDQQLDHDKERLASHLQEPTPLQSLTNLTSVKPALQDMAAEISDRSDCTQRQDELKNNSDGHSALNNETDGVDLADGIWAGNNRGNRSETVSPYLQDMKSRGRSSSELQLCDMIESAFQEELEGQLALISLAMKDLMENVDSITAYAYAMILTPPGAAISGDSAITDLVSKTQFVRGFNAAMYIAMEKILHSTFRGPLNFQTTEDKFLEPTPPHSTKKNTITQSDPNTNQLCDQRDDPSIHDIDRDYYAEKAYVSRVGLDAFDVSIGHIDTQYQTNNSSPILTREGKLPDFTGFGNAEYGAEMEQRGSPNAVPVKTRKADQALSLQSMANTCDKLDICESGDGWNQIEISTEAEVGAVNINPKQPSTLDSLSSLSITPLSPSPFGECQVGVGAVNDHDLDDEEVVNGDLNFVYPSCEITSEDMTSDLGADTIIAQSPTNAFIVDLDL